MCGASCIFGMTGDFALPPFDALFAPERLPVHTLAHEAARVAKRLAATKRPLPMVGVEVRRCGLEERVAELARRLRGPVAISFTGRSLMAGTPVRPVKPSPGLVGDPRIVRPVEESDALLQFGVILDIEFRGEHRPARSAAGGPRLRPAGARCAPHRPRRAARGLRRGPKARPAAATPAEEDAA